MAAALRPATLEARAPVSQDSLQALVDALSITLGRPVLLDDALLAPLAYSRHWGEIDVVRRESILTRGASPAVQQTLLREGIADTAGVVRTKADARLGMAERVCVPVRKDGEVLAYIWLLDPEGELTDEELVPAHEAAGRAAALLLGSGGPSVPNEGSLLEVLCSGHALERDSAARSASERGLIVDGPVVLCLIAAPGEGVDPLAVARTAARRLSVGHAIAGHAKEGAALVAAVSDPVVRAVQLDEVARWVHTVVQADIVVGQSGVSALNGLDEAARQAGVALRVARSGATGAPFASWSSLGADRLVVQLPRSIVRDVPEGLSHLLDKDAALAATLEVFLDAAGDVKATAMALSLHRSGVYHRLRRIEEVTGLRLNSGDHRLLAHLGIRTRRLF